MAEGQRDGAAQGAVEDDVGEGDSRRRVIRWRLTAGSRPSGCTGLVLIGEQGSALH